MKAKAKKKLEHNGWLSPKGKFIVVDQYGHCEAADRIIAEFYPLKKKLKIVQDDPETFLETNGWIKLSSLHWHSMGNELTQPQLDFVFDWCVQGDIQYPPKDLE